MKLTKLLFLRTSHKFPSSESAPVITIPAEETTPSTSVSPTITVKDDIKVFSDKEAIDGTVPGVTVEVSEPDIEILISK